jgi:pilus assembly protein Flp/PilA
VIRTIRKRQRVNSDEGASAVEYGLLVAAIAAVIVLVVFALGGIVSSVFHKTCSDISSGASVGGQSC